MVWSLEEIQDLEDLQLLSGYINMLLGNIGKAQVFNYIKLRLYVLNIWPTRIVI